MLGVGCAVGLFIHCDGVPYSAVLTRCGGVTNEFSVTFLSYLNVLYYLTVMFVELSKHASVKSVNRGGQIASLSAWMNRLLVQVVRVSFAVAYQTRTFSNLLILRSPVFVLLH